MEKENNVESKTNTKCRGKRDVEKWRKEKKPNNNNNNSTTATAFLLGHPKSRKKTIEMNKIWKS